MAEKQERFLTIQEVQSLVGLSRAQIYRLEKQGLFPKRIRVGQKRIAFSLLETMLWQEVKKDERRN